MGTEEFMKLAENNENMCAQEIADTLKKYSCTIHYQQHYVDGQIVNAGIFFKFRPEMLMQRQPTIESKSQHAN